MDPQQTTSTYPPTLDSLTENVLTLLRSLGNTSHEIAQNLKQRKIRGVRKNPHCCPVSNLLTEATGLTWVVDAKTAQAIFRGPPSGIGLPEPVQQFVQMFDKGFFSYLDKTLSDNPTDEE